MTIRFSILITVLLLITLPVQGGVINTGFLISQANQDADLTMNDVPRNITDASDNLELSWEPRVSGVLKYSLSFRGPSPDAYQDFVEEPVNAGDGFVIIRGDQLPVGVLFCIIDGGDEGYSAVFRVIRAADSAPEMIAPITAAGRMGVENVTPVFQWQSIQGVPYYHIIVSDQPFEINEDDEGNVQVEGANIIWQTITSQTSIMYGIPDPSEFFESDNIPPLIGNNAQNRGDRPRYAWLILNNYGNHPAYSSTVTGGVSGFEIEVNPPFDDPENLAPEDNADIYESEILFRWTRIPEANSYFIYVSRDEVTPGGSQAFIPAWNAQTTLTSITCPAGDILQNGDYVWKVLAANQQGRGTLSDVTGFEYFIENGTVVFHTNTADGDWLQFVELTFEPIEGAALAPTSTDDRGYHEHTIPVGTYRFHANKSGYEEAITDVVEIEDGDEIHITLELTPLPSSIVGTTVDNDENPVSAATVTAYNVRTGEEVTTETDIGGEYQLDIEAGNWNVSAVADGYEPSEEVAVAVEEGHNYDLDDEHGSLVLIEYQYIVSGSVRNPAGEDIQLAEVTIENDEGELYRTYTPGDGRYTFTIGIGDWIMNARKPGFYLESGNVPVEIINRDIEQHFTLIPQAGILSGQVMIDDRLANRNADIWFIPDAGEVTITRANQIGGFSQGLDPGDYMVTPVREGHHTNDSLEISIGPGETISGVRLELHPNPSSISGRIVDTGNEPLQNAVVSAAGVTTNSDAQGNYRLNVASGNHIVTATKHGYVTEEIGPVDVEPGQNIVGINLRLNDNAGVISGRVYRGNDAIYDAVVTASRQVDDEEVEIFIARTDRQGNYTFGLRYGIYRLTVQRDGFVAAPPGMFNVQLQPGQEVTNRNFPMLSYAARITGSVRSPAGPVSAPIIRITQLDDQNRIQNTTGNVEGHFALTVVPEQRYIVTATRQGYSTAHDTTDVMEIEGEEDISLSLVALPCQLQGIVTVNESPLEAVTVRADGERGTYEVRTGVSGTFQLNLESGEYNLSASKPGYTQTDLDIRLNPGENRGGIELELEENFALLAGATIDPDSEPITGTLVTLIDVANDRRSSQFSDQDGAFSFERLLPGNYRIEAEHLRYARGRLDVGAVVGGQERQRMNIIMEPLESRIEGVVESGDEPVGGATVYARFEGDEISARTNDNGEFSFPHVASGEYNFLPARVGYTGVEKDTIVGVGDTLVVELTMIRNDGRILGSVVDPDDIGLRGARISAFDELGHFVATETSPDGSFTIENLYPLSEYTVTSQLAGYSPAEQYPDTIRGVEVGREDIDFHMIPNSLRLSGRTVNQAGTIITNTSVQATSLADGSIFRTTSDTAGVYRLRGLAAHTRYRLQTHRFEEYYINADQSIETGANHMEGDNGVNLEIIEHSSSISGNVGIREVTVEIFIRGGERAGVVYTGAEGTYSIVRLREGDYTVTASKVGYRVTPPSREVNGLDIGEEREDVDFELEEIRVDIIGSVIDGSGSLAGGVPVLAWSQVGQFRDTTDSEGGGIGTFQFENLLPNQVYSITTELPNEGYDNSSIDIEIGEQDVDGVQLSIVRHNASLTGVARRSDNNDPLNGVHVTLDGIHESETDENGQYSYSYLAGGDHTLSFLKSGYVSVETEVNTGNGENVDDIPFERNVSMEPLRSALYGRILRLDTDTPLSGCVVIMTNSAEQTDSTITGSDGSYNFNNQNTNLTYHLDISKKGFIEQIRENLTVTEEPNPVEDINLTLTPSSISGIFATTEGIIIPNAPVILRSFDNTIDYDTTDHAGDFTFHAETGNYMLMAAHPESDQGTSYNRNIAFNRESTLYTILQLANTGVIQGRLETEDGGAPSSSGYIVSRHEASGVMVFNWSPGGTFLLRGLRPGGHVLTAEAAGYAMLQGAIDVDVSSRDTTFITVILTQSGKAITGYITDQSGNPVERIRVSIEGPTPGFLITTEDGYYHLSDPDAGNYTISVERIGYDAPADTTFTLEAGDIVQIDRSMNLVANAVSGRVFNEFAELMDSIDVLLIQDDDTVGTNLTNSYGEYQFRDLSGEYIVKPIKEYYGSEPESAAIYISEGESIQNLNFVLVLVRGIGSVTGLITHGDQPVGSAELVLRDLDTGERLRTNSDSDGLFEFSKVPAPATLRLRATLEGFGEKSDSTFRLTMDSTAYREISFPAGQIKVRLLGLEGTPILNRPVYISGVDVEFDTTLYSDVDGTAETLDWLTAGQYSIVPSLNQNELPPAPAIIDLQPDEQRELVWHLEWTALPLLNFNYNEDARVEILIPDAVNVLEGFLYYKGPGSVEWESLPLERESGFFVNSQGKRHFTVAAKQNEKNSLRHSRFRRNDKVVTDYKAVIDESSSFQPPEVNSADQGAVYYAIIPRQNRGGTLYYYLEVHTGEGYTFGGPSTVQQVQITNKGKLDHLDVRRTLSSFDHLQIGIPILLEVTAYDDADSNLTAQLGAEAFVWAEIDTVSRGELNQDDPTKAIYTPLLPGFVQVNIRVTQADADITIGERFEWTNKNWVLGTLSISSNNVTKVAAGDSILLTCSAKDTTGASMPVSPTWLTNNPELGHITSVPLTLTARFSSDSNRIGMARIAVSDSAAGITAYFNEDNVPDASRRGLWVYSTIRRDENETKTFGDGMGFEVVVPPGAGIQETKLFLQKPEISSVKRLTPKFESTDIGYYLSIDGSLNNNVDYILKMPVPSEFVGKPPLVGSWYPETVSWQTIDGQYNEDSTKVEITINRLVEDYGYTLHTLISASDPLAVKNLKFNPNPFSPYAANKGVSIEFELSSDVADRLPVTIKIYNMAGELVRTLVDDVQGMHLEKGIYRRDAVNREIKWDGKTDTGRMARNGRYIVVLKAKDSSGEKEQIGTVVLIK